MKTVLFSDGVTLEELPYDEVIARLQAAEVERSRKEEERIKSIAEENAELERTLKLVNDAKNKLTPEELNALYEDWRQKEYHG